MTDRTRRVRRAISDVTRAGPLVWSVRAVRPDDVAASAEAAASCYAPLARWNASTPASTPFPTSSKMEDCDALDCCLVLPLRPVRAG